MAYRTTHYEMHPDDGTYYGEVTECRGVYANARTVEECRNELAEVLEDWLLMRIHKNLAIPVISGLELRVTGEAAV